MPKHTHLIPLRNATSLKPLLLIMVFLLLGLGTSLTHGNDRMTVGDLETNIRVPVVIKNLPQKKETIFDRMKFHRTPGVSIALINQGEIILARGYGVTQEGGKQVGVETLFQAGSISKPVAALGVLALVKKGAIDLDKNVNDYLTSWKIPDNDFTKEEKVTVRRLLSHTAGLTVHGFPGYSVGDPIPSLVEVLKGQKPKVNTDPVIVEAKPGSRWSYSGGGFEVLQLMVEDVTGQSFEKYMEETILAPLGMTHSTYEQPLSEDRMTQAATGHNPKKAVEGKWHIYPEKAAAGLWTTPTDLAKMMIAVHGCSIGDSTSGTLIKRVGTKLCHEMLTRHKWPSEHGATQEMGLGFMIHETEQTKTYAHGGVDEGFIAHVRGVIPSKQSKKNLLRGSVIMTNSMGGGDLGKEIDMTIDDVLGWESYHPIEKTIVSVKPELLKKYAGIYARKGDKFQISIQVHGDHLKGEILADGALNPEEFFPESDTTFFNLTGATNTFRQGKLEVTPPGEKFPMVFDKN